ncbi:hypothetical protein DFH09DRAFT_1076987 [Mycena vulgaris]|nr:hypothetical protein DFH09DRAFT_1076987 [Mycena vulgaris]
MCRPNTKKDPGPDNRTRAALEFGVGSSSGRRHCEKVGWVQARWRQGSSWEVDVADKGGTAEGDDVLHVLREECGPNAREGRRCGEEDEPILQVRLEPHKVRRCEGHGSREENEVCDEGRGGVRDAGLVEVYDAERDEEGGLVSSGVDDCQEDEGLALRTGDNALKERFGGGMCDHGVGPEHKYADEHKGGVRRFQRRFLCE